MSWLDPLIDTSDVHSLPLTSVTAVLSLSGGYLVAMALLSLFMNGRKPFGLRAVSLVHNSGLALYSLYAFLGLVKNLHRNFTTSTSSTLTLLFCDTKHEMLLGGDMNYILYHFYLSKVFEWLDTALLILRGKKVMPPSTRQFALHLFHHTTAISIVFFSWRFPLSTSWLGPLTNSTVHIVMYGYYALTDMGLSRKWGLIITPLQLGQFILCLLWVSTEWISLALGWNCGTHPGTLAWVYGCYLVFLALFWSMYQAKRKQFSAADKQKSKKN